MIRAAIASDAAAIADVHFRARAAGYAHVIPAAYNASLSPDAYVADWETRLAEPARTTLVADEESGICGFVRFGAGRGPYQPAEWGTVELLYVLPETWGAGVGKALLVAAEAGLAATGFHTCFLAVYEENGRARSFFERNGWAFDGTKWQLDRGGPVTQLRYVKQLP